MAGKVVTIGDFYSFSVEITESGMVNGQVETLNRCMEANYSYSWRVLEALKRGENIKSTGYMLVAIGFGLEDTMKRGDKIKQEFIRFVEQNKLDHWK